MDKKITQETIAAQRAECLSLLTVWAEEMSAKERLNKLSEGLLQGSLQ